MKRNDIVIMEQDKGVVIMNKSKYTEKGLTSLSMKQFQKLDPAKSTEEKVQRILRKIKSKLTIQEYKRLYPTGSCPVKFYSTAKLYKIDPKGLVDDLTIRPIISNINKLTDHLSKYLAKLLAPL